MSALTISDISDISDISAGSLLPHDVLLDIEENAAGLDSGAQPARRSFGALGACGALRLGAPFNTDGALSDMASVLAEVAGTCMSTAFSMWANRMTLEYLLAADTPYAGRWTGVLSSGQSLGITAMASAFRELAGCGSLELTATPDGDGFTLDGPIRWASNLYEDSLLVTAARTGAGEKIIVALPVRTDGISVGKPFSLLALGSTASSFLTLTEVSIAAENVLTLDFEAFLASVRPTFMVLQTSLCVGLARTSLAQARHGLVGVNSVFTSEVNALAGRLVLLESAMHKIADSVGGVKPPTRRELLSLRLAGAELATAATTLEVKTAGGKGYASGTPASRRFRESAFLPVQSPSEAQLRWELESCI